MVELQKNVDRELYRIRRLPENRICPNCLKEDRIGWKGVCTAFQTFVCPECKSAHQSFSHRCKAVDMSVWKMDEVKALDEKNGGGNKMAQLYWLARMPEGARPTQESTLDDYKKFVQKAYIDKLWVDPDGSPGRPSVSVAASRVTSEAPTPVSAVRDEVSEKQSRKSGKEKKEKKEKKSKSRGRSTEGSPVIDHASPNSGSVWTDGSVYAGGMSPSGTSIPGTSMPGRSGASTPWNYDPTASASALAAAAAAGGMPDYHQQQAMSMSQAMTQATTQQQLGSEDVRVNTGQQPYQQQQQQQPQYGQQHRQQQYQRQPSTPGPASGTYDYDYGSQSGYIPRGQDHYGQMMPGPSQAMPQQQQQQQQQRRLPPSTNPWMPPIDATNPWAVSLLRRHLGLDTEAAA
mmetsp:Transcript_54884/g.117163  ORF Transcript_54884/g.117163 Transcript_54884/m.117163 type:complete len:402 (-) Transcript_54884:193-1398(-)